ncbi:MAG: GNAT family N-acetyltransferase [Actinomycetota bacterium]
MTEVSDRVAAGLARAWEINARAVGGTVERADGVLIALTEIADPQLNVALIEREPEDPPAALAAAKRTFSDHGFRIGLDLCRGRHPAVERAAADLGLIVGVTRPAMAAAVSALAPAAPPPGVEISTLSAGDDLEELWAMQAAVFGMRPDVARAYLAPSLLGTREIACLLARFEGRPVSSSLAVEIEGTVGVFGVATVPDARGRGIGTAVTAAAADWARERADLAWLQASEEGRHVYERMGFAVVGDWDVWVLPPG